MQSVTVVARALDEMAGLLEFMDAPRFKVRAYEQGADVVRTLGDGLGPLVEQGGLQSLPGIGATLSRQIEELWNTGTSQYLSELRAAAPEGASELVQVPGLSPKRIRALHDALGIRSVEELVTACVAGRVRGVKGFGVKTEERLRVACERWLGRGERGPEPTLLHEALELAAVLGSELAAVADNVMLAGDVRRGLESAKQLDFVVSGDASGAVEQLRGARQVVRVDAERAVATLAGGLEVVVHGARPEELGSALVFATGSAAHLEALAARAAARSVTLSARPFADEASFYRALELPLIPPELRAGTDEVGRAERGELPELVELGDVRGFVHCHTTHSDGRHSVLEMARAAHARGMEYITITDHSPSAHYARGVALDRLKAQWDEIEAARAEVPIRILRGTESDILSDGALDYPDDVLASFDVVIASIHARHRQDASTMTARLVRALSLPVFKIWGHALGRILNHREPIDCDVMAVLDALAGSRGAVELNADPHRLDLPPSFVPAARERGIPFVISVDAHSTRGLDVLRYGVTMARRGGLTRADVLNTRPADEFARAVKPA